MNGPYDDMLHLPRHSSATRPRMPRENRAAQFSPFAALTGYEAVIAETARATDRRIELSESEIVLLDEKLRLLAAQLDEAPTVSVTYFQPDKKKDGGAYVSAAGRVKKLDAYRRILVLMDDTRIAIDDILELDCALFAALSAWED